LDGLSSHDNFFGVEGIDDDDDFLTGAPDSDARFVGLGMRDRGSVPVPAPTLMAVVDTELST
jgi:hypothetical protein